MNELLLHIGVGGLIAYVLVKEVLGFLGKRNGHSESSKFIEVYREEGRLMRHELRTALHAAANIIAEAAKK